MGRQSPCAGGRVLIRISSLFVAAAASSSCPCTGANSGIDVAKLGENYGKSCKSWDDGITDPANTASCTTYEKDQDGLFCCRAWCYVDNENCDGTKTAFFPSFVQGGSGKTLYYSYDTCDQVSTVTLGYTEAECPFEGPRNFQPSVIIDFKVRDFSRSHPHFGCGAGCEWPKPGYHRGIVKAELVNGKPVLADKLPGGAAGQPSAVAFEQWYSDDTCAKVVPTTMTYDLQKKVHRFESSRYTPFGNGIPGQPEGPGLFTTEIHIFFRYNGGEIFDFRGDDDVWVFINNKLAVDLGGCHGPVEGSVNLDAKSGDLGIVKGNNYELVLFQAERCFGASNFKAEMTLRQDQGICPNACHVSYEQGHCELSTGKCVCYGGWGGNDCGTETGESPQESAQCNEYGSGSPWIGNGIGARGSSIWTLLILAPLLGLGRLQG